ncbi:MAG: DUF6629 family protein [Candidatus Uhrbacteria bacterium]
MCFSAGASFVTGGVLAAVGVAVVKRKPKKRERLFAAIPFLFAIQQLIEGAQWLFLKNGSACFPLGYGFLFFAFILWPTYIPCAVYMMERNKRRRRLVAVFLGAGVMSTLFLIFMLLSQSLSIDILHRSISYVIDVAYARVGMFVYAAIVCGSLLVATDKHMRLFGLLLLLSFIVSYAFFQYAFTSVWCFFAAALSVLVYLHFHHPERGSRR